MTSVSEEHGVGEWNICGGGSMSITKEEEK